MFGKGRLPIVLTWLLSLWKDLTESLVQFFKNFNNNNDEIFADIEIFQELSNKSRAMINVSSMLVTKVNSKWCHHFKSPTIFMQSVDYGQWWHPFENQTFKISGHRTKMTMSDPE